MLQRFTDFLLVIVVSFLSYCMITTALLHIGYSVCEKPFLNLALTLHKNIIQVECNVLQKKQLQGQSNR